MEEIKEPEFYLNKAKRKIEETITIIQNCDYLKEKIPEQEKKGNL